MNILQKKPRIKATLKYLVILILVLMVTIFQDYLHSRQNDYSFYASESFLFNMYWILILPIVFLLKRIFSRVPFLVKIQALLVSRILFVILASLLHIIFFAGLVHLVSALFYSHTFTFLRNLSYTLSEDLYKYLLIYSVIALLLISKKKSIKSGKSKSDYIDQIILSTARTKTVIKTSDFFYIAAEAPYISIQTDGKKYLHSTTLKSILEQLDPEKFVRIHKSTIVNLSKVHSYKSRLNGDYDLLLTNQQTLRLSRNYVNNFKKRFLAPPSS